MSAPQMARWSAPESLISVEYSMAAMEHVRQHVIDGFHRILRGGLEVGGILFGQQDPKRISVSAVRPVEIEYASGPVFLLSEKDTLRFAEAIEAYKTDKALGGTVPLGWYVSHTRSVGVSMAVPDQEIFSKFFPERWQVTLVLRPGRMGIARAGFFTRDADGRIKVDAPYREFEIAAPFEPAADARTEHRSAQAHAMAMAVSRKQAPAAAPVTASRPGAIANQPAPALAPPLLAEPRKRSMWRWLFLVVPLVLVMGAAGGWWLYRYSPWSFQPGLSLFVLERGGAELELEWRPAAVANAENAVIEVNEGDRSVLIPIKSRQQLMRGFYPLRRKTGDVNLRLTAYDGAGSIVAQEATRFVGENPVIPASPELMDARAEIERLKAENGRLQVNVEVSTLRARQAELKIRQLQLELKNEAMRQ